jgi:NAD-dependent DNA ligase
MLTDTKFLESLSLDKKKKLYKEALPAYEVGNPLMSDKVFDALENRIKQEDPNWSALAKTGVKMKKMKTPLYEPAPSLGKVYPEAANKWLAKSPEALVLADKLDGSSIQLLADKGRITKMITRGDGTTGQDISFLLPYVKRLPSSLILKTPRVIRCEAIMKQEVFEKKYAEKYDNPRNLVAGILNRSLKSGEKPDPAIKDIDIVVLGVYGMTNYVGLNWAEKSGFLVVEHEVVFNKELNALKLGKLLKGRRANSLYEMDGLVLSDALYEFGYDSAEKPKWAIAFKENLSEADAPKTKVVDVIWQTSHNGRLIPKVQVEPVRLDGAKITYATVHNAEWMTERGIGPGAVIQIVRSGGVIPKITNVIKKASKLKLPDVAYEKKGVHFVATEESLESETKSIYRFLLKCGVESIALKTVTKLYEAGTMESYLDYVIMSQRGADEDFIFEMKKAGFTLNTTKRICAELAAKLSVIDVNAAMIGTGSFAEGIGERRLDLINKTISTGQLLDMSKEFSTKQFAETLSQINGIGPVVAKQIVEGIRSFRRIHLPELQKRVEVTIPRSVKRAPRAKKGIWAGKFGTWTGYRNKDEESQFVAKGGQIVSFGSKTNVLFMKEGGKASSKITTAKAKGINVTTWEEFRG